MQLSTFVVIIWLQLCTESSYCASSKNIQLESLISDQDENVDKFLTKAYIQIGSFMAESLFTANIRYSDYFDVIADVGVRFLSLSDDVRNNVIRKFLKNREANKTQGDTMFEDQIDGVLSSNEKILVLEMLLANNVMTDTEKALDFIKIRNLELGKRLEKIFEQWKKQYLLSSPEVKRFVRTELGEILGDRRSFDNVTSQNLLNKIRKRFLKLTHSEKVGVAKIFLSAFHDILKKHFGELTNSLTLVHLGFKK